jgi:hypothetical protein
MSDQHSRPGYPGIADAVALPEAAARYYYRLLVGDRRPRWPVNPHEEEEFRELLRSVYPNDPESVEAEMLKMRAEHFDWDDASCFGPNWRYLDEALAAHCHITSAQARNMTFAEIANALEAACRREGLLPSVNGGRFAPEPPDSLSDNEYTILRALRDKEPRSLFIADLAAETGIGETACKNIVNMLIGRKLAHRPTHRGGAIITPKGKALLATADRPRRANS